MTSIISGFQGEMPAGGRPGAPFVAGPRNVAACAKHYVGDGGTARRVVQGTTTSPPLDRKGSD